MPVPLQGFAQIREFLSSGGKKHLGGILEGSGSDAGNFPFFAKSCKASGTGEWHILPPRSLDARNERFRVIAFRNIKKKLIHPVGRKLRPLKVGEKSEISGKSAGSWRYLAALWRYLAPAEVSGACGRFQGVLLVF